MTGLLVHRSLRRAAVLAAMLAVAAAVGIATGAIPDSSGKLTGCYGKVGGVLRVIDTERNPPQRCLTNLETQITWNQKGPAGLPGADGAPGPAGADGSPGAQGEPGPASTTGQAAVTASGTTFLPIINTGSSPTRWAADPDSLPPSPSPTTPFSTSPRTAA